MAAFGLVFAEQALSGFPQSVYICALVYGAFALFRAIADRQRVGSCRAWLALLGGIARGHRAGRGGGGGRAPPAVGARSVSDRVRGARLGVVDAPGLLAAEHPDVLSPYINGDISDNTYIGPPFFWEDYGYVGVATFLLAVYGGVRERRRPVVVFSIAMTLVAYLLVLGRRRRCIAWPTC